MAEQNNSSSHFGSGFFIGSLIGAGAVFLLGTKKGKKLLKALTEEGLDSISEMSGVFEEIEDEDGAVHQKISPKKIEKKIVKKINQIKKSEPVKNISEKIEEIKELDVISDISDKLEPALDKVEDQAEDIKSKVSKKAKRLFKGIKRK